jgi:hypothetical protein
MATLQARIENYAGILGDSETWNGQNINLQADQWTADAINVIVGIVSQGRPDLLPLFASNPSFSGRTLGLGTGKSSYVLDVFLDNHECVKISPQLKRQAADTNSIYYAVAASPVYYIENNSVKVLPDSGTATANVVVFDTAIDVSAQTGADIDNFPTEFENLLVLFVASKVLQWKLLYYSTLYSDITVSGDTEVNLAMADLKASFDRARDMVVDDAGHTSETNTTDGSGSYSSLYWLIQEDSEMVASANQIAQQEIQTLSAANTELNAIINKDTVAYNWLTAQKQAVMQEIASEMQAKGLVGAPAQ